MTIQAILNRNKRPSLDCDELPEEKKIRFEQLDTKPLNMDIPSVGLKNAIKKRARKSISKAVEIRNKKGSKAAIVKPTQREWFLCSTWTDNYRSQYLYWPMITKEPQWIKCKKIRKTNLGIWGLGLVIYLLTFIYVADVQVCPRQYRLSKNISCEINLAQSSILIHNLL